MALPAPTFQSVVMPALCKVWLCQPYFVILFGWLGQAVILWFCQGMVRQSVVVPALVKCGYASLILLQNVCCSVSDSGY
jgi:hypothetical protein